jgi:DNA helicase HerA-like ATPase
MNTRKVGYIVGEVETNRFLFVSDTDAFPPRHEYIIIPNVKERLGEDFEKVDVLAQVSRVANYSDILGERLSLDELETIINRYSGVTKVIGEANILGYMNERSEVMFSRSAAIPGQEVYIANKDVLEQFFSKNIESGIQIGNLVTRSEVRVCIDPNGFRRHVAIIAQTGAGKSYLVGIILEKLLPLGASIIVFDPNSDYVMMKKEKNGANSLISENTVIYRPPGIHGRRYTDDQIGGVEEFTIDFGSLDANAIADVAGIGTRSINQREAVRQALDSLEGIYGPDQLIEALNNMGLQAQGPERRIGNAALAAITYIRRLSHFSIWGNRDIPINNLTRPKNMSIIDLAGLQRKVSEYIVTKTLNDLWSRAVTGSLQLPTFVILEEAHNLAPGSEYHSAMSSSIVDRIAAEGRKFGIFLMVITQRPNKISQNVLSQCNSQIIMRLTNPEDMNAVRRSSERLSEELFHDLPGLNKGEAIVVGELTRVPTMVRITGRTTEEGGSDIDVVAALDKGLELFKQNKSAKLSSEKDEEIKSEW